MRVSRFLSALLLLTGVGLPTVLGQGPGRRMPLETLRTSAIVKIVRPQALLVVAEDGRDWLVSVPNNFEHVVFQATATADWLQARMPVRFKANVAMEKHKKEIVISEPITELTVATLRPDVGMGIFPEPGVNSREDLLQDRNAGLDKKSAEQAVETPCLIIGLLAENKEGKLRVAAGRIPVRVELAPAAEISVVLHDVKWVRPGDKAEITARFFSGRVGQAEGQQITITAAKPLAAQEGPGKGRRRLPRRRKSGDSRKAVDVEQDNDT